MFWEVLSFINGTSGRTRTGTLLRAGDFESPMSTNSITLALILAFVRHLSL